MPQANRLQNLRLGEVIDIRDGTHDTPQYVEQGIPLITSKNLADSGLCFRDVNYISEENHREISKRSGVERGDILYGIIGTIGKPTLVETDRKFSIKNVALFKQSNPEISNRYLRWLLKSPSINKQIAQASKGGTQKFVSLSVLRGLEATFPPFPEQIRIAAILDQADSLRVKRRDALAQLDSLMQSIFIEMFGDPVTNSKKWQCAEMTDVVIGKYGVKAGPFGSSLKKEDYTPTGYRVYGQEQVIAGRFDIGDYYIGARKFEQLKSCAVCEGDLLVSLVGSFGKVLVVPPGIEPGIINPRLLKITPNPQLITSVFLAATLTLPATQMAFERMAHGGTMGILNAGLLKQLIVMLPPLALQHEYEKRVSAIERLKQMHCTSLADFNALFASLQCRAFCGEL